MPRAMLAGAPEVPRGANVEPSGTNCRNNRGPRCAFGIEPSATRAAVRHRDLCRARRSGPQGGGPPLSSRSRVGENSLKAVGDRGGVVCTQSRRPIRAPSLGADSGHQSRNIRAQSCASDSKPRSTQPSRTSPRTPPSRNCRRCEASVSQPQCTVAAASSRVPCIIAE
jgi:hypothetical protein